MAHLLDYEEAVKKKGDKEAAFAALDCADAKSANARAWNWAETAVGHAVAAALCTEGEAMAAAGHGRRPDTDALRRLFRAS